MTKKRNGLTVIADLDHIFESKYETRGISAPTNRKKALTIEKALEIVVRQMRTSGMRERTVMD